MPAYHDLVVVDNDRDTIIVIPTLFLGLLVASLWSIDHYWRNLTVSWLATVSVTYFTAANYHRATLMQNMWLFALTFTLLLWAILLTPVQLLIRSTEERVPTAEIDVILDPVKSGFSSDAITADIIAVHGLGSNSETTWTNPVTGTHWIRNVLAQQFPTCRIALVNHDTRWDAYSKVQSLRDYGQTILNSISRLRVNSVEQERPLIFIGHSFGGILIKKALTLAAEQSHNARLSSVASSTGAIFFLGTPHKGSNFALLRTLSSHFSYWLGSRSDLLEFLTPTSTELSDLHLSFLTHYQSVFICNLFETKPMEVFGIPFSLVVTRESATIDGHISVPLAANHKMLQRFSSSEDSNYIVFRSNFESGLKFLREKAERKRLDIKYTIPFRLKGVSVGGQEFVGRVKQLEEMHTFFKQPTPTPKRRVLVLQGLGGIGKTHLAMEYAIQNQQEYTAILWTNGRTETALRLSFAELAEQIPIPDVLDASGKLKKGESGIDQAIDAVKGWFGKENNTKWLLVLDNIDSQSDSYDIRRYIPSNTRGHVLITTRLSRLRRLGYGINVEELDDDDALIVLSNTSGRSSEDTGAREIVKRLQGLPLALCHAGAYMSEAGISAAKYIELYNQKSSLLLEQDDCYTYEHGSISYSWAISFAGVQSRSLLAQSLLMLWAFLDNFDVWWGLFHLALENPNGLVNPTGSAFDKDQLKPEETHPQDQVATDFGRSPTESAHWLTTIASDESVFIEAIKVLREFSFVQSSNDDSSSFSIHPVVHEWANGRQDTQQWHGNLDLAVMVVGRAVPLAHHKNAWILSRRLTPTIDHLIRMIQRADPSRLSSFDSMVGLAFHEFDRGNFTSAKALYQIIIPGLQRMLGEEHPKTIFNIHNQALCYRVLGDYERAEADWKWTLQITTRLKGEDAEISLRALDDLGRLCMDQDRAHEAYDYFSRSLAGKSRTQPGRLETFDTMRQLGLACQRIGKLDEAHKLHQAALGHFEKELGPNHTWTLLAIKDIGVLYHRYSRLEEAIVFLQKSLETMESQLGPGHNYVLEIMEDLAKVYEDMNSTERAEDLYMKALDGYSSSSMGAKVRMEVLQKSIDRVREKRGTREE